MHRLWSRSTCIVLVLFTLLLAACGGSSGSSAGSGGNSSNPGVLNPNKKYTVEFWNVFSIGANKTAMDALTKQYMQEHPNVTIKTQSFDSYNTLQTKLTAAIAANKAPTVAQLYENWAVQYQQSNAIVSLQPFITGKNGLSQSDLADFYPSLLKDGQINGTQYMLPFNKSDMVLYYNADLLQKKGIQPPTTLQEFTSDLTKLTNGSQQWGLSYTPDVDGWSILYKALGGGDFVSSDDKTADFANSQNMPYTVKALDYFAPLVKSGAIHVTKGYNWQNDFIAQKSAFAISTIASYPFLAQPIGNTFKFSEAPMPAGPSGQFTVLFGSNLALFSGDADTESAGWDYMKFLTSSEADATFVKQTGYMPVRQSTFNSPTLQSYYAQVPARKVGPQSINNAFVASIVPAWQQCRDIIDTAFPSVLTGQSTAEATATKMGQQCTAALQQG
jgi:multiple sugar transport system substrate-binding protein